MPRHLAPLKRYISSRPFEIVADPLMSAGYTWEGVDVDKAVENWEIGKLAEKFPGARGIG